MRVGYALLTLFPGRVGGSEANAAGVLGEFAQGRGHYIFNDHANRHVMSAYTRYERGPVRLHHVASYWAGDRDLTRLLAMGAARALPGRAARDVPAGLDVLHYPVTVPIPRPTVPHVVTLFDVQHHDLPGFFSRAERTYRRWAYDAAARGADVVVATSAFSAGRIAARVGVEPERIEVVHMGIDPERFS
ncbi:MAG: glycosyltransferase, partial [Actinomycetota bacterium]|nr:glycosyltransferase [Actinomycetota bacterium]